MRGSEIGMWARTALLLSGALVAGACTGQTSDPAGADSDRRAGTGGCDPDFPSGAGTASGLGSFQYYRLAVQFRNCIDADIPLSIDMGPTSGDVFGGGTGTGVPLERLGGGADGAAGGAVRGSALLWTDGNKDVVGKRAVIPKGSISGAGAVAEFATIPFWDGYIPSAFGPCATSVRLSKGKGPAYNNNRCTDQPKAGATQVSHQDFRGEWAVYLPTATIETEVVPQLQFPYVPDFFSKADWRSNPGALATGMSVVRLSPGQGIPSPLFNEATPNYRGGKQPGSPPTSTFLESGSCLDNLVVKNGANEDSTKIANWSTRIVTGTSSWNMAVVGDGMAQASSPVLFLTKGWMATPEEIYNIQLGDKVNTGIARRPHFFQGYLQELSGIQSCAGAGRENTISLMGTRVSDVDLSSSTLIDPVLANSSLSNLDFTRVRMAGRMPVLSFDRLANGSTMIGAEFGGADLIGSVLPGADLTAANLQGVNLAFADLSTADMTRAVTLGVKYCHTLMPDPESPNGFTEKGDAEECKSTLPDRATWPDNVGRAQQCGPAKCAYISVYNNTTRSLAKGLVACESGDVAADVRGEPLVAPLRTGQIGFTSSLSGADADKLNCSVSYANGPWGKVRIQVTASGGGVKQRTDAGFCAEDDWHACLPKAAPAELIPAALATDEKYNDSLLWPPMRDGKTPIRTSSKVYKHKNGKVTVVDVNLCEPEAFDEQKQECPSRPALPEWRADGTPTPTAGGN